MKHILLCFIVSMGICAADHVRRSKQSGGPPMYSPRNARLLYISGATV